MTEYKTGGKSKHYYRTVIIDGVPHEVAPVQAEIPKAGLSPTAEIPKAPIPALITVDGVTYARVPQ